MFQQSFKHKIKHMQADDLLRWLAGILIFSLLSIACVIGFYIFQFNGGLSEDAGSWGVFGDFIGGTLNPTLSFLALIALLLTIILQNKELDVTREELKQ